MTKRMGTGQSRGLGYSDGITPTPFHWTWEVCTGGESSGPSENCFECPVNLNI